MRARPSSRPRGAKAPESSRAGCAKTASCRRGCASTGSRAQAPSTGPQFKAQLAAVKRNYFRLGLAFDKNFETAFTEQELNANAMLYGDSTIAHAVVNTRNFEMLRPGTLRAHAHARVAGGPAGLPAGHGGVFCQPDCVVHKLVGTGLDAGRRRRPRSTRSRCSNSCAAARLILRARFRATGCSRYGYFPCFDRRIPTYDATPPCERAPRHDRGMGAHARTTRCARPSIARSTISPTSLIRDYRLADGSEVAFLVDAGEEIKLSGNAACVLALVQVLRSDGHAPLAAAARKAGAGHRVACRTPTTAASTTCCMPPT